MDPAQGYILLLLVMVLWSPSIEQLFLLPLLFTFMPLLKIADQLIRRWYFNLGHLSL